MEKTALNIFEGVQFKHFQDSLDAEMKRLTALGVGANIKEAQSFTEEQEEKLWSMRLLWDHSPTVLLNTLVFMIGRNFALGSGQEHRDLKFSQLKLEPATESESEKLIYLSYGEKNNLGGIKHRRVRQKRVEHYANPSSEERCMVQLYKKYIARCPQGVQDKYMFYLSPRRKWKISDEGNRQSFIEKKWNLIYVLLQEKPDLILTDFILFHFISF